jgi:hypothetical protein
VAAVFGVILVFGIGGAIWGWRKYRDLAAKHRTTVGELKALQGRIGNSTHTYILRWGYSSMEEHLKKILFFFLFRFKYTTATATTSSGLVVESFGRPHLLLVRVAVNAAGFGARRN